MWPWASHPTLLKLVILFFPISLLGSCEDQMEWSPWTASYELSTKLIATPFLALPIMSVAIFFLNESRKNVKFSGFWLIPLNHQSLCLQSPPSPATVPPLQKLPMVCAQKSCYFQKLLSILVNFHLQDFSPSQASYCSAPPGKETTKPWLEDIKLLWAQPTALLGCFPLTANISARVTTRIP